MPKPRSVQERELGPPLAPAAAQLGPARRHPMGLALEVVFERPQLRRLAEAMSQSLREQPVGEPRVARQQGSMQIRPDRAADTTALPAARTVVAETRDDPPQGLRARVD